MTIGLDGINARVQGPFASQAARRPGFLWTAIGAASMIFLSVGVEAQSPPSAPPAVNPVNPAMSLPPGPLTDTVIPQTYYQPYQQLRWKEDYRYLRDPAQHNDWWDPIKYIQLNGRGDRYLTLGGEVRERYEYYNRRNFGAVPQDDGYLLQRFMFHADLHLGKRLRLFGQLQSGFINANRNPPGGADLDALNANQLFVDLGLAQHRESSLNLRIGRQELAFGSNRLVDFREGATVRSSFDGVRLTGVSGPWTLDVFSTRPRQTRHAVFTDGPDPRTAFWGVYSTGPFHTLPGGNIDIYYLGRDKDKARFDQGTARDIRHSIGTRLWGQKGQWDYNWEFVYQFGRFGPGAISAWTASSSTGYTFTRMTWKPHLVLKADIASGDRDASGKNLNTFDPLFPSGQYFNLAGLAQPFNLIDVHPNLELHPSSHVSWNWMVDFLWRESLNDGFYSVGIFRTGQLSRASYIGTQLSTIANWQVDRHLSFLVAYTHHFAGEFLHQTPPGKDSDYFSSWVAYKF